MEYTITQFKKDFPSEEACLEHIFQDKYGKEYTCPKCSKSGGFYRVKKRRSYACAWCGYQLYPTAKTIFYRSRIKLTDWFFAIYIASNLKAPLSLGELKKYIGVTGKTAERMLKQINAL